MWRDVGRHADGDAGAAVEQQVRQTARHDAWLFRRRVVVRHEIDGVLVDISQDLVRDCRQAGLGVAHGGSAVTVDRAKVSLAIDQGIAHVEVLRQANQRVIDGCIAMRVVVLEYLTDHTGALAVPSVGPHAHFGHGVEHTAVNRLETVPGIRQSALNDNAHGVIEIRLAHFGIETCQPNVSNFHERFPLSQCRNAST